MTNILTWLEVHYVAAGQFLLVSALSLLIATLGTALPQLGLVARWPRQLAKFTGLILIFLGGALALAKVLRPHVLRQLPWIAAAITCAVGVVLSVSAWALTARYGRTTQQRLQPMADAAWRTISRLKDEGEIESYARLQTPNGRAAIDEIISNISKKQSTPLLLTSPSGAGKTCTLMSLAAECKSAFIESRRRPVIAIYIDVAEFAIQSVRVPLRDYILNQVGHDAEFIRLLREAWADKRTNIIWLFLFDDADRALMRWGAGEGVDAWSTELIDFLNSNPLRFRAVLAGRDLLSLRGKRIELSPLSRQARDKFLSSRGVTVAQQTALMHEKSFRQYIDYPGWLDLVSGFLAEVPGNTPNSFRDLMDGAITRQIEAITTSAGPEFSHDFITKIAEQTAVRLVKSSTPYDVTRIAQVQFLSENGYATQARIECVINELIQYGILIRYYKEEEEVIAFRRESVRSHFVINAILGGSSEISIDELLGDPNNTAIAISLLQFGSEELVRKVLEAAQRYLTPEPMAEVSAIVINRLLSSAQIPLRSVIVEDEDPSLWTGETYHLLHILDSGLERQPSEIPEVLRETTDIILAETLPEATPRMREQMLDIQALASNDVAAACCAIGLRSRSGRLVDAAARKVMARRELLDLLAIRDRVRFIITIAFIGVDSWTSQHIDLEYSQRLRFASLVGMAVGPLFFIVFGISDIVEIASNPSKSSSWILTLIIAVAASTVVITIRKSPKMTTRILARIIQPTFIAIAIMAALGVLSFVISFPAIITGHLGYVSDLLGAYVLLWPMSSIYYLAIESAPIFRRYAFPFTWIAIPFWSLLRKHYPNTVVFPTRRQLVKVLLFAVSAAVLFTLINMSPKGLRFGAANPSQYRHIHAIAIWTAWTIVAICVFITPITDYIGDWRRIRRWKYTSFEAIGDDVMVWLSALHTRRGTKRMIAILTRREPTRSAIQILPSMYELQGVLEWVKELSQASESRMRDDILATMPSYLKPETKKWIRQYDQRFPGRLYSIANSRGTAVGDYVVALSQLAPTAGIPTSETDVD